MRACEIAKAAVMMTCTMDFRDRVFTHEDLMISYTHCERALLEGDFVTPDDWPELSCASVKEAKRVVTNMQRVRMCAK
jgi:hypothetical protein